jgi:DNA-binding transcriptional regulator YdaS (Cro superfamily)
VAARLGVAHSTVLRWAERGVPPHRVADVARVTGIPAAELRPDLAAAFGVEVVQQ